MFQTYKFVKPSLLGILQKYPGNFIMVHFAVDNLEQDVQ